MQEDPKAEAGKERCLEKKEPLVNYQTVNKWTGFVESLISRYDEFL